MVHLFYDINVQQFFSSLLLTNIFSGIFKMFYHVTITDNMFYSSVLSFLEEKVHRLGGVLNTGCLPNDPTTYLKKVFWPNLGVESSFQVLDILEYACGLKLGLALILNQNPFFEIGCKHGKEDSKKGSNHY